MPENDCKGFCEDHKDNTAAISRHNGMWRVLLAFGTLMILFSSFQFSSQRVIEKAVVRMDKTYATTQAATVQRINEINHRLDRCDATDVDHEQRLRNLERPE